MPSQLWTKLNAILPTPVSGNTTTYVQTNTTGTYVIIYILSNNIALPKISIDSGNTFKDANLPLIYILDVAVSKDMFFIFGFTSNGRSRIYSIDKNNNVRTLNLILDQLSAGSPTLSVTYSGIYLYTVNNNSEIIKYIFNGEAIQCTFNGQDVNKSISILRIKCSQDNSTVCACGTNGALYVSNDGSSFQCYYYDIIQYYFVAFRQLAYHNDTDIYITGREPNKSGYSIYKFNGTTIELYKSDIPTNDIDNNISIFDNTLFYLDGTKNINSIDLSTGIILQKFINSPSPVTCISTGTNSYVTADNSLFKSYNITLNANTNNYINSNIDITFTTDYTDIIYYYLYSRPMFYPFLFPKNPSSDYNTNGGPLESIQEIYDINVNYLVYVSTNLFFSQDTNNPTSQTIDNAAVAGIIQFSSNSIDENASINKNILDTITVPLNVNSNFIDFGRTFFGLFLKKNNTLLFPSIDNSKTSFSPIELYNNITSVTGITGYKDVTSFYIKDNSGLLINYGELLLNLNVTWITISGPTGPNILDTITITSTLQNTGDTHYITLNQDTIQLYFSNFYLLSHNSSKKINSSTIDLYIYDIGNQSSTITSTYTATSMGFPTTLLPISSLQVSINLIWASISSITLANYFSDILIQISLNSTNTTFPQSGITIDILLNNTFLSNFTVDKFINRSYTYTWSPYNTNTIKNGMNSITFRPSNFSLIDISTTIYIDYTTPTITINSDNYAIIQTIPILVNLGNAIDSYKLNVFNVSGSIVYTNIYSGNNSTTFDWSPYLNKYSYNGEYYVQLNSDNNKFIAESNHFTIYQDCLIIPFFDTYSIISNVPISWDKIEISNTSYSINEDKFNITLNTFSVASEVSPIYNWVPFNTNDSLSGEYTLRVESYQYFIYHETTIKIINSSRADYGLLVNKKLGVAPCSSITLTPPLSRATTNTVCIPVKKNNVPTTTIKIGDRTFLVPCGVVKYLPEFKLLLTKMTIRDALLFLIQKYNIEVSTKVIENKKRYTYATSDAKIKFPILQYNSSFRLGNFTIGVKIITNPQFSDKIRDSMVLCVCNDDTKTFSYLYTDMLKNATYWMNTLPTFKEGSYTYCIIRPTNGNLKRSISGSIILLQNQLIFTPIILRPLLFIYEPYLPNTDITIVYSNTSLSNVLTVIQETYFEDTVSKS